MPLIDEQCLCAFLSCVSNAANPVCPEMKGFSPRNLKYMRAFAEAWPDSEFVQQAAAQLPWGHNLVLLDKLPGPETRRWYAAQAIKHN